VPPAEHFSTTFGKQKLRAGDFSSKCRTDRPMTRNYPGRPKTKSIRRAMPISQQPQRDLNVRVPHAPIACAPTIDRLADQSEAQKTAELWGRATIWPID
jgi:hypothetical protein